MILLAVSDSAAMRMLVAIYNIRIRPARKIDVERFIKASPV
jgi:hypothetical protein